MYDVLGVGNALVDIQTQVSDKLVAQFGFDKGIMTLVDNERQLQVLGSLDHNTLYRCAGGSAANTIVAIAEFGGKSAYIGKVSNDEVGEFFLKDMRDNGVKIDVERSSEGPTGTCAVLITDDAQRTMLTNLGVSATLDVNDVDEAEIKRAKYVYVEGYLLTGESTKAAAMRAIEIAKQHGVKVAFTASDPFLVNMLRDELWELIKGPVDLLFCNEEEAKSLTGKESAEDCAQELHKHAENVAMTLGAEGSIVMHDGQTIRIPGVPCQAIDTTGAGDMYAGAFLYAITNGMTWQQAGTLASHAASRIVSQMGARLDQKFTPHEVEELIAV
ncbi:adenosine kinase [Roseimaritima ulvae]|uniref:adenosine kinase n=1 Tax=Roseimaritima ulvae TaxID=980254 RepID=A0A5B9QWN1_9BACT|nr:adenosine kinase [Roseimaritima ulvae]QEG42200.1 5-dehydro-2-deoxygluconokinase [Roseimaritima ulvae]